MDIVNNVCIPLNNNFSNGYCRAVKNIVQQLNEFILPYGKMKVENYAYRRINVELKSKAGFGCVGKFPYWIFQ
jgi:hypothetical protein